MSGGLRIEAEKREDAECIADALSAYGCEVEHEDDVWIVTALAPPDGAAVTRLLAALKACLDDNQIPSIKMRLDARSYVMEGKA
jgi:hypothetical protein